MRTRGRICLAAGALVLLVGCGGVPAATEQAPPTVTVAAPAATTEVTAPAAVTDVPVQTAVAATPAAETPVTPATGEGTASTQTPTVNQEPGDATEVPASETAMAGGDAAQPSVFGLRRDSVWIATGRRVIGLSEGRPEMPIGAPLMGLRVSPDGSRLVYNAGETDTSSAQLTVQSTQTGETTPLGVIEGGAINPVFSPDSNHIAYAQVNSMDGWQLKLVNLQTGEERVLQEGFFGQGGPALVLVPQQWTSTGLIVSRIAWFGETNTSGLFHVDPETGGLGTIWEQGALTLTLSPDNNRVAMVSGSLPMGGPGNMTLSVVDTAGGQTQVAREQLTGFGTPEWSPDSTKLAYVDISFETGVSTLYVFNADGSAAGELRYGSDGLPGMVRDIAWRDNGTLLLVATNGSRVIVSEVAAGDLAQATPRELAAFEAEMGPGTPHEIVYVPR